MNGNRWKVVLLLSVVLPVSFLISFKLSGFAGGPATITDTITLKPANWVFERPSFQTSISDRVVNSSYVDAGSFHEDAWIYAYADDRLWISLNVTANMSRGYVAAVNVRATDDYLLSWLEIDRGFAEFENLSVADYREGFQYGRNTAEKASIHLLGVGFPGEVSLFVGLGWVLESPYNQTEQLAVQFEMICFNGTSYKKIAMPFQFELIAHDRNNFETAEELRVDEIARKHVLGSSGAMDFYKMYLAKDVRVRIDMTPPGSADFMLYLYSPETTRELIAKSTGGNVTQSIECVASSTGLWFVEVQDIIGEGIYTLQVMHLPEEVP